MRPETKSAWTALWLAAAPLAANGLGFALGLAWLLPVLGAGVAFPVFLDRVRAGRFTGAFGWMLFWVVFQSAAVIALMTAFPERAAHAVHRGPEYAAEMLHWVRTGVGAEGSPRLFLPVHAAHFAAFCALTALTAGAAGLVLGTWLLNYMNYYVVTLTLESADPLTAALMGWHPWAVLRVVGYIATATALAAVTVRRVRRRRGGRDPHALPLGLLATGFVLVVIDAIVKALLAPAWREGLLRALGTG